MNYKSIILLLLLTASCNNEEDLVIEEDVSTTTRQLCLLVENAEGDDLISDDSDISMVNVATLQPIDFRLEQMTDRDEMHRWNGRHCLLFHTPKPFRMPGQSEHIYKLAPTARVSIDSLTLDIATLYDYRISHEDRNGVCVAKAYFWPLITDVLGTPLRSDTIQIIVVDGQPYLKEESDTHPWLTTDKKEEK